MIDESSQDLDTTYYTPLSRKMHQFSIAGALQIKYEFGGDSDVLISEMRQVSPAKDCQKHVTLVELRLDTPVASHPRRRYGYVRNL
jgi:hypothetical protein